jgi:hypothetical protein
MVVLLGPINGRALADRQSTLAASHPSLGSNGLYVLARNLFLNGHCSRLTQTAPDIAVGRVDLQNGAQIFNSGRKSVLCAQNACDAHHGRYRPLVELEGLLITLHGAIKVVHLFGQGAWNL